MTTEIGYYHNANAKIAISEQNAKEISIYFHFRAKVSSSTREKDSNNFEQYEEKGEKSFGI